MGDCLNIGEVFKQVNISKIIGSSILSVGERSYKCGREETRINCVMLDWRYDCEHVVFQHT